VRELGEFFDKVVVVTGGASGIGEGIVKAFSKEGAKVIFADVDKDKGVKTEVVSKEESNHQDVYFVETNLAMEKEINQFSDFILDKFGRVDVLVNNVGVNKKSGTLTDVEIDVFEEVFKINALSSLTITKQLLPLMLKNKGGAIINISSTMSVGTKNDLAYSASKGYINTMTKSLALDYATDKIRVNAIAPGVIDTPAIQPWMQQEKNPAGSKGIPMGEIGKTEDIANAAIFLASQKAAYITGQILTVDGGLTVGE